MNKILDLSDSTLIAVHYTSIDGFQLEVESLRFGFMQIQLGYLECYIQKNVENSAYQDGIYVNVESKLIRSVYKQSFETLPLEKCIHIDIVISGLQISVVSVTYPTIRCTKEPCLTEEFSIKIQDCLEHAEALNIGSNPKENDFLSYFESVVDDNLNNVHEALILGTLQRPIDVSVIDIKDNWLELFFTSDSDKLRHNIRIELINRQLLCIDELIYYEMLRKLRMDKPEIGPIYEIYDLKFDTSDENVSSNRRQIRIEDSDYIFDFLTKR